VPEQHLEGAQIGPRVEQVRGEGVAQRVRRHDAIPPAPRRDLVVRWLRRLSAPPHDRIATG